MGRFKNWKKPNIIDGELTQWNWMVQNSDKLKIGNNVDIGAFTYINAHSGVFLGKNVQIGSHCSIYSISTIDGKKGAIHVGKNSCIGSHSTVMPGVAIGENVKIGAHSFVNKNIPDNCTAYGCPVKIVSND
jgi:serine acetyltransferase